MKSIPKLALALALALSGASAASAATTVYHVAGASSFRVALLTSEVNYLASVTTGTVTGAYAGNSGFTGNNVSLVEAPVSTGTIVFENNLSGSIAGDESVSAVSVTGNANKIPFPTPAGLTLSPVAVGTSTTPASGGTANVTFTNETTYADIAYSDVSFATAQKVIKLATSATASANSGGTVGVVVYDFVANATSDVTDFGSTTDTVTIAGTSTITSAVANVAVNVTQENFSQLYSNGALGSITSTNPTIFTGAADTGYTILAVGRDLDSGTRATALAETGYPLSGNGAQAVTIPVDQVYPLDGSGNVVGNVGTNEIESFEQVPAESVDGIALAAGDGGYNSGGNEAKGLSVTIDASANPQTVFIGYLGVSDAYSALTASGTNRHPAILLGYNGSTFNPAGSTTANGFATQTDINKVYYGQYTFWGYEQVFYNSNNAGSSGLQDSANPSSVVSSLVSQLKTNGLDVLSSAGVKLSGLVVSRTDDGLQVQ